MDHAKAIPSQKPSGSAYPHKSTGRQRYRSQCTWCASSTILRDCKTIAKTANSQRLNPKLNPSALNKRVTLLGAAAARSARFKRQKQYAGGEDADDDVDDVDDDADEVVDYVDDYVGDNVDYVDYVDDRAGYVDDYVDYVDDYVGDYVGDYVEDYTDYVEDCAVAPNPCEVRAQSAVKARRLSAKKPIYKQAQYEPQEVGTPRCPQTTWNERQQANRQHVFSSAQYGKAGISVTNRYTPSCVNTAEDGSCAANTAWVPKTHNYTEPAPVNASCGGRSYAEEIELQYNPTS